MSQNYRLPLSKDQDSGSCSPQVWSIQLNTFQIRYDVYVDINLVSLTSNKHTLSVLINRIVFSYLRKLAIFKITAENLEIWVLRILWWSEHIVSSNLKFMLKKLFSPHLFCIRVQNWRSKVMVKYKYQVYDLVLDTLYLPLIYSE